MNNKWIIFSVTLFFSAVLLNQSIVAQENPEQDKKPKIIVEGTTIKYDVIQPQKSGIDSAQKYFEGIFKYAKILGITYNEIDSFEFRITKITDSGVLGTLTIVYMDEKKQVHENTRWSFAPKTDFVSMVVPTQFAQGESFFVPGDFINKVQRGNIKDGKIAGKEFEIIEYSAKSSSYIPYDEVTIDEFFTMKYDSTTGILLYGEWSSTIKPDFVNIDLNSKLVVKATTILNPNEHIQEKKLEPSKVPVPGSKFSQVNKSQNIDEPIPTWIKNNAGWWAEEKINDFDFTKGIQYLITKNIIHISNLPSKNASVEEKKIPDWVRNNADWWSKGLIVDSDFISGIKYLVEIGIISVPIIAEPEYNDIIIIGAGISGLAAADYLHSKGYDVVIVEARDRIGGRIWTSNIDSIPIDLGASWIHGEQGNPISKLAANFGVETIPTEHFSITAYEPSGKLASETKKNRAWSNFQNFHSYLTAAGRSGSIQDQIDKFLERENLSRDDAYAFLTVLHSKIEEPYGADSSDLSAYYYWKDEGFEGSDVIFPHGYVQIVNELAEGLDIRLNNVVLKIEYDEDGVTVNTNNGIFEGKIVLCTLPLGVLRDGAVEFSPPLPQNKIKAINNLEMGVMNKIVLSFSKAFWDEAPTWIMYVPENDSNRITLLNMYKFVNEPILVGFVIGNYAKQLETQSDEEILSNMMTQLKIIYGEQIPEPNEYAITRWGKDKFSQGSYSHIPPAASSNDFHIISLPVDDRVFFAGESTIFDYYGTVHGAYLSGIREAERIDKLLD